MIDGMMDRDQIGRNRKSYALHGIGGLAVLLDNWVFASRVSSEFQSQAQMALLWIVPQRDAGQIPTSASRPSETGQAQSTISKSCKKL